MSQDEERLVLERQLCQDAVSSVVGTVLMLGITVSVFAGVSLVVLSEVGTEIDTPRADLAILRTDDAYLLQHRGGESLSLANGYVLLNLGGAESQIPLTDWATDAGDDGTWDIGDTLCISCAYPIDNINGILVIYGNALILSEGERGIPVGSDVVDFVALNLAIDPAAPWNAGAVTATFTIENQGTIASTVPISVAFSLDGIPFATEITGPVAVGESRDIMTTWTGATGSYLLSAEVDALGVVAEFDETNNDATLPIEVTLGQPDPGFAYDDTNNDGLYEVGVDFSVPIGDLADGIHDAGGYGLVIPPSVGPLSAPTWDIDGTGTHRILVDLTATSQSFTIDSTTEIRLGAVNLTSQSATEPMRVQTQGGNIRANGTTFDAGDTLVFSTPGTGRIDVVDAVTNSVDLTQVFGAGGVDARRLNATSDIQVYLYASAGEVDARGATLDSGGIAYVIASGDVRANDITITSASDSYLYSVNADTYADRVSVTASAGYMLLLAGNDIFARDAVGTGWQYAFVYAIAGDVDVQRSTWTATPNGGSGLVYLYAPGGSVMADDVVVDGANYSYNLAQGTFTARNAVLDGNGGTVYITAEGAINVERSDVIGATITIDGDTTGNSVTVQDTCFQTSGGAPNNPTIAPAGITIAGTPACGNVPVNDPGFPYEDTNNDGAYTAGVDGPLVAGDVTDGIHDAGGSGLVIPASVGPITASEIDFDAGGDVFIDVALTATSDHLRIDAGGDLEVTGNLETATNNKDIELTGAAITAQGVTMLSRGHITLDGGPVDVAGSTLDAAVNNKNIDLISSSDLTATNAVINARGEVDITASGDIFMNGLDAETLTNGKDVDITATGDLWLQNAALDSRGHIRLGGDEIRIEGASMTALQNGDNIIITSTDWLHADAATVLESRGATDLTAESMRVEGIQITGLTNGENIDLATTVGIMDADGANVEGRGHIRFVAEGDLGLDGATLTGLTGNKDVEMTSNTGDIDIEGATLTAGRNLEADVAGVVRAQGASLADNNNLLDVTPNGATTGTPASGGFE